MKKDRNIIVENNYNSYEVCGVIASDPINDLIINESFSRFRIYKVVLNWSSAYLTHSIKIEIIGNVFFNLKRNEIIDLWKTSCNIAEFGFPIKDSESFNLYPFQEFKEYLKSIKTPSFHNKSFLNWILKYFTLKLTNR